MAKKYLQRVEELVERYGGVGKAYEAEMGNLYKRIAEVESEYGVTVDMDELLPQRAKDMAAGNYHYRERRKWIEDIVRIRKKDILQYAKAEEGKTFEEEPDSDISNEPIEDKNVSQTDTYPYEDEDRYYPEDNSWNDDYDDYEDSDREYEIYDDDEFDDIYEPDAKLPPSLADIQLENLANALDEYGENGVADDVRKAIDNAVLNEGKEAVGTRVNANFSKLQKNLDNAVMYEEDAHKYNYFMSEVLKCIRGYGFTKDENIQNTEAAEKQNFHFTKQGIDMPRNAFDALDVK